MCSWKFYRKLIEVLQAIVDSMPFFLFYLVLLLPGESQLIKKLCILSRISFKDLVMFMYVEITEFSFKSTLLV